MCRTQFVVFMMEALFKIKSLPTFISKHNLKFVTVYHLQRSCGKVMFLHLSVILFTGGCLLRGVCHTHTHPWADNPRGQTPSPGRHPPWEDTPLGRPPPPHSACWDTINKRPVRNLLECDPVRTFFKKKLLEDISPYCGISDTPVTDFWWRLPWVSNPGLIPWRACFVARVQWIPQNHFECNTYWRLGGQFGDLSRFPSTYLHTKIC